LIPIILLMLICVLPKTLIQRLQCYLLRRQQHNMVE
jgi:hypothetical protein